MTLPTEAEFASLPRSARVALAARCAARVLPLYAGNLADRTALTRAVRDAERVAIRGAGLGTEEAGDARHSALKAHRVVGNTDSRQGQRVARAVRSAASAYDGARHGFRAMELAERACRAVSDDIGDRFTEEARADFDLLARLAGRDGWEDGTPVDLTRLQTV